MNQEYKSKWLEALRSGNYRQTTGRLKRISYADGSASYCCLGVLAEVCFPEKFDNPSTEYHEKNPTFKGDGGAFSPLFLEELGITEGQQSVLIRMNDKDGEPFDKIAGWIEQNL